MRKSLRDLGRVKLVQVQPSGLIIETPSGYFYDVTRRVEVGELAHLAIGHRSHHS